MRVYDGIVMDRAYVYNTRGTGRISADKKKGGKKKPNRINSNLKSLSID